MYIEGPLKSGKTAFLIDKFIELINSGISTSEILVICSNSYKRKYFTDKARVKLENSNLTGFGNLPIYTFNGIVYNSILNNWPVIEEKIIKNNGAAKPHSHITDSSWIYLNNYNAEIIPNLCGLEATEYILQSCLDKISLEETNNFNDYRSGHNLKHQLLRRYRLVIENSLTDKEIQEKSAIINDPFCEDAKKALSCLKEKAYSFRSLDYLNQTEIFLQLIQQNLTNDFDSVKYLFADDVDEFSYSAQTFIKALIPNAKLFYLAADPKGGARRGYLCAYPDGWEEIKRGFHSETTQLKSKKVIFGDADDLFGAIRHNFDAKLENISLTDKIKRAEMLDEVLKKIAELLETNSPEDIKIITPIIDENIKCSLVEFFDRRKIKYQFLSGSKKLIDNPIVSGTLIITQLINKEWNLKPTDYEIRILLTGLLGFPVSVCKEIIINYKKDKKGTLDESVVTGFDEFDRKYQKFIKNINAIKEEKAPLYEQLIMIFTRIIAPIINETTDMDDFNRILKSLDDFMKIIDKFDKDKIPKYPEREWLIQIKNTVVSDNPPSAPEIQENSIIIATPQRIIDLELESKYQLWLDVSCSLWIKDDTGPLYNSWVFQKNWNMDKYTPELNKELTLNKTAHVLRKLILCANNKIFAYSSQLDSSGNENIGTLHEYLDPEKKKSFFNFKTITPRDDQKPVLEYKGGKMAVPAVPGAGKTTIMQALIIELIKKGAKPGEILVLTYMESAARIFQQRIKESCPELNELPYISTIHGLAYKIIQDEDNFVKLNLDSDFRICDDTERPSIIREICQKYLPEGEKEEDWIKLNTTAISRAKIGRLKCQDIEKYLKNHSHQQLQEFLPIYKDYTKTLDNRNVIDYDDLLVMATQLLKDYPEIRNYYQKQFRFVIEDEAQDSSRIQQELISIISDHHGNLVRCGDINQAIMTTFTNADVKGFADFIKDNYNVEMVSSQRCAKEIYQLANHLIDWSNSSQELKDTFLDIKMQPVVGKNPDVKNSLNFKIFETQEQERSLIINEIRKHLESDPDTTIGVLINTNPQVFEWASFLEKNNIKTICRTDTLKQKKVFRFILKFLEVIENPWDNKQIQELYDEFVSAKIFKKDFDTEHFLKTKMGSPFISFEVTDLGTENLVKFWWDVHYWIENSYLSPEELVIKIGTHYFDNIVDKSNVHLLAILIKKYVNSFNDYSNIEKHITLPGIVKHFKELSSRARIGGVKFFSESDEKLLGGYVQVMTMHKAKGDEFDVVFMPEMHENMYSYSITPETFKIKPENLLLEKINELTHGVKKTNYEIITEQMAENLRLIYVGITRAKKFLYMSSSYKVIKWNRPQDNLPSRVLEYFVNMDKSVLEEQEDLPLFPN